MKTLKQNLIIWSDKSMVGIIGFFNRLNAHYWSRDDPQVHRMTRHQHCFDFDMWVGISGTHLKGIFFTTIFLPWRITTTNWITIWKKPWAVYCLQQLETVGFNRMVHSRTTRDSIVSLCLRSPDIFLALLQKLFLPAIFWVWELT